MLFVDAFQNSSADYAAETSLVAQALDGPLHGLAAWVRRGQAFPDLEAYPLPLGL